MNNCSVLSFIINFILTLLILNVGFLKAQASDPEIKIHYLGHSAFVLRFDNEINIVTDYGKENAWVQWDWDSPINDIGDLVPDVMTFSHQHEDHYDPTRIPPGVPNILTNLDSLLITGITIKPIRTCETDINIESNTSFIFSYKGLTICHLGDAQALIMNISDTIVRDKILANFPDQMDLLFMTIDGQQQCIPQAEAFVELLNPKRIIPMHHWSENYLQDFLNHLTDQNNTGSNYRINEIGNAKYDLSLNEIVDPIKVISLTREPYYIEANVGIENDDYYSN
ncbi:MBL fold metallo-hydrolase [Candidatus Neomarinimicrobiota bacterium]